MKYCSKCGKELKDNDGLCTHCGTNTEKDPDANQILKATNTLNESTSNENIQKNRSGILTFIFLIGIILLTILIILIIIFVWHGFIDASNFISFSQIQSPTS